MTPEQMKAEIAKLQAENGKLMERALQKVRLAVSAKGAVSIYGLRRLPVTFYAEEWAKLYKLQGTVEDFIAANRAELSTKDKPLNKQTLTQDDTVKVVSK